MVSNALLPYHILRRQYESTLRASTPTDLIEPLQSRDNTPCATHCYEAATHHCNRGTTHSVQPTVVKPRHAKQLRATLCRQRALLRGRRYLDPACVLLLKSYQPTRQRSGQGPHQGTWRTRTAAAWLPLRLGLVESSTAVRARGATRDKVEWRGGIGGRTQGNHQATTRPYMRGRCHVGTNVEWCSPAAGRQPIPCMCANKKGR
jgi:hypothetical protein